MKKWRQNSRPMPILFQHATLVSTLGFLSPCHCFAMEKEWVVSSPLQSGPRARKAHSCSPRTCPRPLLLLIAPGKKPEPSSHLQPRGPGGRGAGRLLNSMSTCFAARASGRAQNQESQVYRSGLPLLPPRDTLELGEFWTPGSMPRHKTSTRIITEYRPRCSLRLQAWPSHLGPGVKQQMAPRMIGKGQQ